MSFSESEKKNLFEKLNNQSVDLGIIKTQLKSGDKKFEELMKTRDWAISHRQHHKTLNWILGIGSPIITVLVGWWIAFKGK